MFTSTVLFACQSQQIFAQYFRYGTNTIVKLHLTHELKFPAVTLCNLNPFKKSQISRSTELNALVCNLMILLYEYSILKKFLK